MPSFELSDLTDNVFSVLNNFPESRDDDKILLSFIWIKEITNTKNNYNDFFDAFLSGSLSNPESVVRIRRKIQEKYEILRGKKWDKRHEASKNVSKFFRNLWKDALRNH